MALLIHEGFEFKNILSGGYKIKEDEPDNGRWQYKKKLWSNG